MVFWALRFFETESNFIKIQAIYKNIEIEIFEMEFDLVEMESTLIFKK